MKHILAVSIKFYKENGLLGVCSKKIGHIKGGADNFRKILHNEEPLKGLSSTSKTPRTAEQLDEILNDERITEDQKAPFHRLREDLMYG